jgi:hypothetical protein
MTAVHNKASIIRFKGQLNSRRQPARFAAVPGLAGSVVARALQPNLARGSQPGFSPNHLDLVLLEKALDSAAQSAGNVTRSLNDRLRVEPDIVCGKAIVLRVTHQLEDLRGTQKRLCRNTPPIEANSAEVLALHDGSFESELRRPEAAT